LRAVPQAFYARVALIVQKSDVAELEALVYHANHHAFARIGRFQVAACMNHRHVRGRAGLGERRLMAARIVDVFHFGHFGQRAHVGHGNRGRHHLIADDRARQPVCFEGVHDGPAVGTAHQHADVGGLFGLLSGAEGSRGLFAREEQLDVSVPFAGAVGFHGFLCVRLYA